MLFRSIVNSVIHLGKGLGLRVVAEGVEKQTELDYLRQQDCDEMQGYLFSRPLPAREFATLLCSGRSLQIQP